MHRLRKGTCTSEVVPATPMHAKVPATPMHAKVPATLMHAKVPATPMHAKVPATPMHAKVPATLMHAKVPETPMHAKVPETPMHAKVPATPMHAKVPATLMHAKVLTLPAWQVLPTAAQYMQTHGKNLRWMHFFHTLRATPAPKRAHCSARFQVYRPESPLRGPYIGAG
jgi:hypothetical protein